MGRSRVLFSAENELVRRRTEDEDSPLGRSTPSAEEDASDFLRLDVEGVSIFEEGRREEDTGATCLRSSEIELACVRDVERGFFSFLEEEWG